MQTSKCVWCVKWSLGLVVGFLFLAKGLYAQADTSEIRLPEGSGKQLVTSSCVGCHNLVYAVSGGKTEAEWLQTVDTMRELGASLSEQEVAVVADYLARHFGPGTDLSPPPGRAIVAAKCFGCHEGGMWTDLRTNRRGWEGVLYRMVGRGAIWTQQEIENMATYLAEAYAPAAAHSR